MQSFSWDPIIYKKHIEDTAYPLIRKYEEVELDYLLSIPDIAERIVVDMGAGYGRVVPSIAKLARKIIAIEIDVKMLKVLHDKSKIYANVQVVQGDANQLDNLLRGMEISNPLVISLQNSLGPWIGGWEAGVKQMRKFAEPKKGDILLSIWRQEASKELGIDFYNHIAELVGEPDLKNTKIESGLFISKTGYKSQWFTKDQRQEIREMLGGSKIQEVEYPAFWILHVSYK